MNLQELSNIYLRYDLCIVESPSQLDEVVLLLPAENCEPAALSIYGPVLVLLFDRFLLSD